MYGTWMIGNQFQSDPAIYGSYPHTYLDRVLAMFPDIDYSRMLHVFAGSIPNHPIATLDIKDKFHPTYLLDVEEMSKYLDRTFDLIFADPPYSEADAKIYQVKMVNRKKVVHECAAVLVPGGYLVWLDQNFPQYNKQEMELVGTIGLLTGTNRRVRCVFIYQRTGTISKKGKVWSF